MGRSSRQFWISLLHFVSFSVAEITTPTVFFLISFTDREGEVGAVLSGHRKYRAVGEPRQYVKKSPLGERYKKASRALRRSRQMSRESGSEFTAN